MAASISVCSRSRRSVWSSRSWRRASFIERCSAEAPIKGASQALFVDAEVHEGFRIVAEGAGGGHGGMDFGGGAIEIAGSVGKLGWVRRLRTLPGVGEILGPTIYLEIGEIARFATPGNLAAYAGLVPSVHSSGGHTRLGRIRRECNQFLKWAFVEAAEVVVCHQETMSARHVVRLYWRVKNNKADRHNKAVVAVARHLAESAWHILKGNQDYREPQPTPGMIQRYHCAGRSL